MAPTTAQTALSTPIKSSPAPITESPGTWQHPRLQEINRRKEASTFTENNIKRIVINLSLLLVLFILHSFIEKAMPSKRSAPRLWAYFTYAYYAMLALPLFNVSINLMPLIRAKDDLSDIPLTPGQRKLMGLPPASTPPTPGSVFITPPRYARSPSTSSTVTTTRSFSSSPILARSPSGLATPTLVANGSVVGSPNYPLLQKAMFGARRSSTSFSSSMDSLSGGASIFGGGSDSPSPTPGKRSSVGLTSKWRYNKGMYDRARGFRDSDFDPTFT